MGMVFSSTTADTDPNMKFLLPLFGLICLQLTSATDLPPNTLVSGSGPVPKIPGDKTKSMEDKMVRSLFTQYCGSDSDRPLCDCDNGDQWNHPYFSAQCVDGTGPTDCVCPNGEEFRV